MCFTPRLLLALGLLGPLLGGCSLVSKAPAFPESAGSFELDPVHSSVVFRIEHLGVGQFYGRFNEITGTLTLDFDEPAKASLTVTVPVQGLDTNSTGRDEHLHGDDFFASARHPQMTFVSRSLTAMGPRLFELEGDLTLLGVKRPLRCQLTQIGAATDPWGKYRTGFEVRGLVVRRSDFGMEAMLGKLGDEVTVDISFEAVRQ